MSYNTFASFYDELTDNISYPARAAYFDSIIRRWCPKASILLDLACGDGRNALYLAQLGMQVEAVDFCPTALQRLNRFASRQNLCLHTKQMDLSDPNAVEQLGSYDLILCNHYRLSAAAADRLREHLLPGGKLWLNGFVRCPQDNPAIRPEDLLCVQDYEQAGYAVEDALEHTDAREHRYLRLILTPIQSKK